MLACRIFGHRYRFGADGTVLRWWCGRGCDVGGRKTYADPERVRAYAAAFDRAGDENLGARAPLIGGLPLRVARWVRRRH